MMVEIATAADEVASAEPEQVHVQKTFITVPIETTSKKYGVNLQLDHEPDKGGYRVSKIPDQSRATVSISAKTDPYKSVSAGMGCVAPCPQHEVRC